jgi:hypothetical protein
MLFSNLIINLFAIYILPTQQEKTDKNVLNFQ